MSSQDIPNPKLRQQLDKYLDNHEKILWWGQPRPFAMVAPAYFLVPFGFIMTGFAVAYSADVYRLYNGLISPLGICIGLFALFLLSSPLWLIMQARGTHYALTNQRALIFEPLLFMSPKIRDYHPADLQDLLVFKNKDATNNLIFKDTRYHHQTQSAYAKQVASAHGFLHIPDADHVEKLIRQHFMSEKKDESHNPVADATAAQEKHQNASTERSWTEPKFQ